MDICNLICALLSCIYIATMTVRYRDDFPLDAELPMDLLVLWVLLQSDSVSMNYAEPERGKDEEN